jgi:hypothetical protein
MPISAPDLAIYAKSSLDEYMRNTPVDQIGTEHPLLKKLMGKRKTFLGAKQNAVYQIRKNYDSNFAWAYGATAVSFNTRNPAEQASFPWRRAVDGFYMTHDELFSNGIKVREGDRGQFRLETNEKVQLVNMMNEKKEVFRLGFEEKLDIELHRDGSSSTDSVTGLDGLISLTPTTGIVGGLDRSTATYWRNGVSSAIASTSDGVLADKMEQMWRACTRNGGTPDLILAGSDFIDAYRKNAVTVVNNAESGAVKRIDAGVGSGSSTGLYFKGVEIVWDPTFSELDSLDAPTIPWEKRCYFINTKYMDYLDDDMDIVTPTRPHDTLAFYQMINLRLVLALKRANAHAVLSIA